MKRSFIYIFATIVLVAMVISCKKDDPAPSVVGTWKFTGYVRTCPDPGDNETDDCTGTLAECGSLAVTATTYAYTPGTGGGGTPESGTYVVSGTTLTISPTGGTASVFTFAVTSTTLTLTSTGSSGCTEVNTLTRQ